MSHNSSDDRAKRKRAEDGSSEGSDSQNDSSSKKRKKHKHDRSSVKKKHKKEKRKKSSSRETKKDKKHKRQKTSSKISPDAEDVIGIMCISILKLLKFSIGPTITVSATPEAVPQQPTTVQRYSICLISVSCGQYWYQVTGTDDKRTI